MFSKLLNIKTFHVIWIHHTFLWKLRNWFLSKQTTGSNMNHEKVLHPVLRYNIKAPESHDVGMEEVPFGSGQLLGSMKTWGFSSCSFVGAWQQQILQPVYPCARCVRVWLITKGLGYLQAEVKLGSKSQTSSNQSPPKNQLSLPETNSSNPEKRMVGRCNFLLWPGLFSGATVDGRTPAPPGMYKTL